MIKLSKRNFIYPQGHSSKGNQFKWMNDGTWYKADYLGYESLAEVAVSDLLKCSNVKEFAEYEFEQIVWEEKEYRACKSRSFLLENEEIWTCERLYNQFFGGSIAKDMAGKTIEEKLCFFVERIEEITGVRDFGSYLTLLLEIDAVVLNEDRHTHNIAFIRDKEGELRPCPVFDNGAALFSDTTTDYPLDLPLDDCYRKIEAKPFETDFDIQMDCAENLFGQQLQIDARHWNINEHMEKYRQHYEKDVCNRVEEVLRRQIRKYRYLTI